MENNNNNSSTNTVLIVLLILIIVGGAVWFMTRGMAAPAGSEGINVDVNLPTGGGGAESGGGE